MAEFDCREFDEEEKDYSSFAYLIGIVRGTSHTSNIATLQSDGSPTLETVTAMDSVVDGWLLLLPESKQILSSTGEVDELLFLAKMWMHT